MIITLIIITYGIAEGLIQPKVFKTTTSKIKINTFTIMNYFNRLKIMLIGNEI